jgi:hypothetical protein
MDLEEMIKRYVVTAAEIGALPNHRQLDSIEEYAKKHDAEVLIIPVEGQNSNDMDLHERFNNYRVVCNHDLGDKIQIKSFNPKAQQINPLTGFPRFTATDKSTIIGSTKMHWLTVPNSNKNSPRALIATGVCTQPNYKNNRIGLIGQYDHQQGGVVVEVDTETNEYQFRQIKSISDGSFIDAGEKWTSTGYAGRVRPDAYVLADIHVAEMLKPLYEASIEQINFLKPRKVIIHDLFDAKAISHHDDKKSLTRAKKAMLGQLDLTEELRYTGEILHELASQGAKDTEFYIVKSNHDEHLDRYLEEGRYVKDPHNHLIALKLAQAKLEGLDPVRAGIELTYGHVPDNVTFLQRDDELKVRQRQLGFHGDKGPSGSRGSMRSLESSLGLSVTGHGHSPWSFQGADRVGTHSDPNCDYAKGSTGGWLSSNVAIYPNSRTQHINTISDKWYL